MQSAKDTFYVVLRNGISTANPQRTVAIRGVLRPAVVVVENELESTEQTTDTFYVRWTDLSIDRSGTVPMARLRCSVQYQTAGTAELNGMDRGRVLSAMDWELQSSLIGTVQNAPKMDYTGATPVPDGTRIFWSDPTYGVTAMTGDRLGRTVTVDVWSVEGASNA